LQFEKILRFLLYPFGLLMGNEQRDCLPAGELLGIRTAGNEFISYQKMGDWMKPESKVVLADRTKVILTYALCGFANFSSIGIQIGGIGGIAPERRHDLARLGLRAMIGGTLACFMTACIAGILNPEWKPVHVEKPLQQPIESSDDAKAKAESPTPPESPAEPKENAAPTEPAEGKQSRTLRSSHGNYVGKVNFPGSNVCMSVSWTLPGLSPSTSRIGRSGANSAIT
jgi:hypothetical protein